MRSRKTTVVAALLLSISLISTAALAQSSDPDVAYGASLEQLNGSSGSGTVDFALDGNMLTVTMQASGLAPDLVHAQHLHGALDGSAPNVCPSPNADTDDDGLVSTPEGVPFYGGINVSLTTEGDTSPDSALAVDRFPVADADGNLTYERTFEVSDQIAENIGKLHVVQHGIDFDDSGAYDGDPSPLDPQFPFEATVPTTCGDVELTSVDGQTVDRLAGATRIETAIEISQHQFPDGNVEELFLTRSDLFADAVAGGSLTGGPTLLVPMTGELPQAVADEIARLAPATITVLGGDKAVDDEILIQAAQAAQQ